MYEDLFEDEENKLQKILQKIFKKVKKFDRLELFVYSVFIIFMVLFFMGVISSVVSADPVDLNGTELIEDPFQIVTGPWTDWFEDITGNGAVFYLFPVTIIALGVYVKTNDIVTTSMFLLITGALLFTGSVMVGIPEMGIIFIIFTAMGIVSLFLGILFQRRVP